MTSGETFLISIILSVQGQSHFISFHFKGSEAAVEAGNRGMRAQSLVSSSYIPETFS